MLDERQILSIIASELQNSSGGDDGNYIDANQKNALAAYLGQPDGKEIEGSSTIVSTDVADAIEWIMPEIIKAFTQNNEVVTFDAVNGGDELQAELESQYVYDILMKQNNGFLIIHQFVKDALMQKNGFIKRFYSKDEKVKTVKYTGIIEPELNMVLSNDGVDLTEITEYEIEGIPVFDVSVTETCKRGKINIISVPPEEFRCNRMHNQVDLSTARFTAHVLTKTASDLIEDGYDKELVDSIPGHSESDDDEYRFYMQGESVTSGGTVTGDDSLREIEVSECYAHIDINEDGIAEFVKITCAGGSNPDVILDIEEIDENPFTSATAILMSHKLFGLSIYDRLKQIQEQKTTLWRNIFNNMYLQNNQRTVVVENQVNLDDLMVSRPGGIIRAKTPNAVTPYVTPPLGSDAYKMMDYLDQVRAGRAGVSPEGPVTDSMVGDRVGSEGIANMMSQKEELVGLMIRVFAETGIKPLCEGIRRDVVKHQDTVSDYKFKGKWVTVNPSQWKDRTISTVRVGTGSGNRKQQQQAIAQILAYQEKMMANPGQALVSEENVYKALDSFAKFSGMAGADSYFIDPASDEGKAKRAQADQSMKQSKEAEQKEKAMMADAQAKIANAEAGKAQAAQQSVTLKNQVDQGKNQLQLLKQQSDAQIKQLEAQLKEAEAVVKDDQEAKKLEYNYWQTNEQMKYNYAALAVSESNNKEGSDDE